MNVIDLLFTFFFFFCYLMCLCKSPFISTFCQGRTGERIGKSVKLFFQGGMRILSSSKDIYLYLKIYICK